MHCIVNVILDQCYNFFEKSRKVAYHAASHARVLLVLVVNLVNIKDSVAGSQNKKFAVRTEPNHLQRLPTILEEAVDLARVSVQNHPLPADHTDHDDVALLGKASGLGLILKKRKALRRKAMF